MSLLACARQQLISMAGVPLMRAHKKIVVHTMVGSGVASAAHASVTEWAERVQSRDTRYQSAAVFEGNPTCLTIETADRGGEFADWDRDNGHAVPAWTPAQCESIAIILVEWHHQHGVPLVLCPDSKPDSVGIAYHRMGCVSDNNYAGYAYGGRVPGGELWSRSKGKVCPGDRRIKQLIEIVIPRARVLAGLDKPAAKVLPIAFEGDEVITVVTSAVSPTATSKAGLLLSSGRFVDISGDWTARPSAQLKINDKTWPELKVDAATWSGLAGAA